MYTHIDYVLVNTFRRGAVGNAQVIKININYHHLAIIDT